MPRLLTVGLYHRDHFSQGNSRRIFGHEAYHWGIIVTPQTSRGRDCLALEATDAAGIEPLTFRMTNPSMSWWLRHKYVDPMLSCKLLGRIVIGQIPDEITDDELLAFIRKVPLPLKNTHPQQSCVSWTMDVILAMQKQGWARKFDVDRFKDVALSYADERMKQNDSTEPYVRHYSG